jgi:hypothetical protein
MFVLVLFAAGSRDGVCDLLSARIAPGCVALALCRRARSLYLVVSFGSTLSSIFESKIPSPSCAFASSASSSLESMPLIEMLPFASPKVFLIYYSSLVSFVNLSISEENLHYL